MVGQASRLPCISASFPRRACERVGTIVFVFFIKKGRQEDYEKEIIGFYAGQVWHFVMYGSFIISNIHGKSHSGWPGAGGLSPAGGGAGGWIT